MAWTAVLLLAALSSLDTSWTTMRWLSTTPQPPPVSEARGKALATGQELNIHPHLSFTLVFALSGDGFPSSWVAKLKISGAILQGGPCPPAPASTGHALSIWHVEVGVVEVLKVPCISIQFLVWCVYRDSAWLSQLSDFSQPFDFSYGKLQKALATACTWTSQSLSAFQTPSRERNSPFLGAGATIQPCSQSLQFH